MTTTPTISAYSPTSQGAISLAAYALTNALVGNPILCATTCVVDNAVKAIMLNTLPEIQNTAENIKLLVIPAKIGISFAVATTLGLPVTLLGTAALYATAKAFTWDITCIASTSSRDELISKIGERVLNSCIAYFFCSILFKAFEDGVLFAESINFATTLQDGSDLFVEYVL
jgi:hypothetical protein